MGGVVHGFWASRWMRALLALLFAGGCAAAVAATQDQARLDGIRVAPPAARAQPAAVPVVPDVTAIGPPLSLKKVIVIDAGHGGHDPGAQSAVSNEKDITLAAARALKARLEKTGRYQVVMTRDSDVYIALPDRVQIARRAGADLFISLHADSAGDNANAHGASVYTLSEQSTGRVTRVLQRNEWFQKTAARASDPAVGQILLDLT